jgi:hypothetical protein
MKLFKRSKTVLDNIEIMFAMIIRIMTLVAIVGAALNSRWVIVFIGCITLLFTFLPMIVEKRYRINIPAEMEIVILLFVYTSLFLGFVRDYYSDLWWWDLAVHGSSGIALGFVGFLIIFVVSQEGQIRSSPKMAAVFSFCFAVALGALWEIFEFSVDTIFSGANMQNNSLRDTMFDLIMDSGGALITSVIGYLYLKTSRKSIFREVVSDFIKENPKFFYPNKPISKELNKKESNSDNKVN